MTEQQPGSSSSGVPIPGSVPSPGNPPANAPAAPPPVPGVGKSDADTLGSGRASLADLVDQPAKVMRIGTMLKQLLEEVRSAPLDDAGRTRLAEIHERSVKELEDGLAPELVQELHRINLPFEENSVPTDAELRVAQAQLVGWLEGLFHGIQAALAAQQMANQQLAAKLQLRQLPPGTVIAPGVVVGEDGEPVRAPGKQAPTDPEHRGPGQYL
ncbi:bacterial proteasome activator family protein [Arthrobacter crusticola]|uniref:Bacterial proteasome activator n=1 Tax=Arthrobacter crusticola TaxID=2547960 RepID=A0A4R5TUY4_9MICC|nr:bacterial proteasome activator family protein [Arthrobacter crusticola]TDK24867.1 bacterial proteasome activator family protein [Arthrobacter crusticola]